MLASWPCGSSTALLGHTPSVASSTDMNSSRTVGPSGASSSAVEVAWGASELRPLSKGWKRMLSFSGCLNLHELLSTGHVAVLVVAFPFSLPAFVVAPPLGGGFAHVQLSLLLRLEHLGGPVTDRGRCHGSKKELYHWTVSDSSLSFCGGGGVCYFFLASSQHCHHSTVSQLRSLSTQKCWCITREFAWRIILKLPAKPVTSQILGDSCR